MAAPTIRVGDIGTILTVTVTEGGSAVNVSSASGAGTKLIKLHRPDGQTLTKTAVFVTDGTNGQLKYTFVAGDISITGIWKVQVFVSLSGWSGHTEVGEFVVDSVLGQ